MGYYSMSNQQNNKMDKQSFLDDFFRRVSFAKTRLPPNFKYSNPDSTNSNKFIESFKSKQQPFRNSIYVSADPAPSQIKSRARYAITIQPHTNHPKQLQIRPAKNYRKFPSNQNKTKNPLFLQIQPLNNDILDKVFPNQVLPRYSSTHVHNTPDLVGDYISMKRMQAKEVGNERINNFSKSLAKSQINEIKSSQNFNTNKEEIKKGQIISHRPQQERINQRTVQKPSKVSSVYRYQKGEDINKKLKEKSEQERKEKLLQRKQLHLQYLKPFNPPTNISAYAYIIYETDLKCTMPGKNNQNLLPRPLDSPQKSETLKRNSEDKEQLRRKGKFPHSQKIILSQNSRNPVQVASLTKIMTFILALELCERFKVDSKKQRIVIGKFESNIGGTSAQISEGQIYTLEDLYYGLMLPSGNDASVAIACWGGKMLLTYEDSLKNQGFKIYKKKACYGRYISQMNALGKKIGLQKSNYANSHGLVNYENKSCAFDLAVLCQYAMKNEKFRKIVSTQIYSAKILCIPEKTQNSQKLDLNLLTTQFIEKKSLKFISRFDEKSQDQEIEEGEAKDLDSNEDQTDETNDLYIDFIEKPVSWENTHRLIHTHASQYLGIKTGITTAAGPCLASCVRSAANRIFVIIVLKCDKMSGRFRDTQNLKKWLYKKEGIVSPKKKNGSQLGQFYSMSQETRQ